MGAVYCGVFHIYPYLLTKQLAFAVPHYRVAIHCHAGVLGVIHKRIAHRLNICSIGTHLIIAMGCTIDGIGIQMIGYHLHCVGMYIQGVFL